MLTTDWCTAGPSKKQRPLEHFPKRKNRKGFPCGHESDSRIVLEGRPVRNGQAVFGGSACTGSSGGAGWYDDSENGGATSCEHQLRGTLSQAPPRNRQCQSGQIR